MVGFSIAAMSRLLRFDFDGTARFITFGTYKQCPIFADERLVSILISHLAKLRESGVRILGYVIMPDHVHLVLHPPEGVKLTRLIGQMKGRVAQEILDYWGDQLLPVPHALYSPTQDRQHTIWQRRCYDRNIRDERELRKTLDYCHANPFKAKLVADPKEWKWSSYLWYAGEQSGAPLPIDDSAW